MNHISWRDDTLVIFFAKSKTNQDGVDSNIPWRIHANPFEPSICPVHSLAVYLFTNPPLLCGDCKLFPGKRQYNRYTDIISRLIADNLDHLAQFGNVHNLGAHSIRKGAATYACSGTTVSPSIVAICLRAGWSIAGAKERYLKFENAGDQFVSRILCVLDCNSPNFAISPPIFILNRLRRKKS